MDIVEGLYGSFRCNYESEFLTDELCERNGGSDSGNSLTREVYTEIYCTQIMSIHWGSDKNMEEVIMK